MHSSVRAGDSGRPGKSSSKTAWLKPAGCERFWAAQAGLRHSVGAACLLPRPGGRGQHQLLGPRGQPGSQAWGSQACRAGSAGQNPSGLGQRCLALQGQ